jgi:hypothetical protein
MNLKIRDLLKAKFGKVKPVSGGSFRIPCPTCDPKNGKKMKRYVSPGWSDSRCFICEETIPIAKLLGENVQFDREYVDDEEVEYKYAKILPYTAAMKLSELSTSAPVIQFMHKDSLYNLAYYDSLGIRYIPTGGGSNISFDSGFTVNTAESLFFPVFGKDGSYVGWQLRFIPGTWNGDRFQFMRYMHLFPKGDHLFNYHLAKQYKDVVVVEGVKKALKLGNSVATLGKGISQAQKQLIQEWKTVTLILDGEDSTQELARDIADEFRQNGRKCVNIDLRDYGYESPDDTTTEQLQHIIQQEHARQRSGRADTR